MTTPNELLKNFPVIISLPVQWGDMDAMGHVNNIIYFKWFESVRIQYVQRIGITTELKDKPVAPILVSTKCDYRKPVIFPDTVWIGASVPNIGRSSFQMTYQMVSESQGAVVADGEATIVLLGYKVNKSQPIPESVKKSIKELEESIF